MLFKLPGPACLDPHITLDVLATAKEQRQGAVWATGRPRLRTAWPIARSGYVEAPVAELSWGPLRQQSVQPARGSQPEMVAAASCVVEVLARLPQLGGREDANSLNSLDRRPKGRHYKAPNGEAARRAVRRRSVAQAVAAGSCRVGAAEPRAPCSVGCGAAGRGAGRRWWADGRRPSGWWRRPRGWRAG